MVSDDPSCGTNCGLSLRDGSFGNVPCGPARAVKLYMCLLVLFCGASFFVCGVCVCCLCVLFVCVCVFVDVSVLFCGVYVLFLFFMCVNVLCVFRHVFS